MALWGKIRITSSLGGFHDLKKLKKLLHDEFIGDYDCASIFDMCALTLKSFNIVRSEYMLDNDAKDASILYSAIKSRSLNYNVLQNYANYTSLGVISFAAIPLARRKLLMIKAALALAYILTVLRDGIYSEEKDDDGKESEFKQIGVIELDGDENSVFYWVNKPSAGAYADEYKFYYNIWPDDDGEDYTNPELDFYWIWSVYNTAIQTMECKFRNVINPMELSASDMEYFYTAYKAYEQFKRESEAKKPSLREKYPNGIRVGWNPNW